MKKQLKNWPESEIYFIGIEETMAIHEEMIKVGGGREGIRDFTLLHSAVERPKAFFAGQELYSTIFLKAAALLQSLIKNHPFEDGNKRTGYFSILRFLYINGWELIAKHKEIIKFALLVDTKNLDLEEISLWIKKHSRKTD